MRARRIGAAAAALVAAAAFSVGASPAGAAPSITQWIGNLNSPRGVAFDGQGSLYVSESGVAGPGDFGVTQSGRVSKYPAGSTTPDWQTSLESLYAAIDPSQPPDVLGPAGISAMGNGCMKNSNGQREGCQVQVIMSESHDGVAAETGGAVDAKQAGLLLRVDGASGAVSTKANVGDQMFAWTGEPQNIGLAPNDFPDSNPFGVLVTKGAGGGIRTFVADAGANTISEVMPDGTARIISYIPNETSFPGTDATPTCVALGPDGMLYVATLHLVSFFVNGPGQSDVWRVDPNANYPTPPTLWAHGLSTPTSCTFDQAGNFWATEMFTNDIARIPFSQPTQITRIGDAGSLPLPSGIAQGPDGAMYVGVNAAGAPGTGAIMRVTG